MRVCRLLYADRVGVFASRTSALAGERKRAFRAIGGEDRPDFRPISDLRKQPVEVCKAVLVQVVRLAGAAGLVTRGNVAMDGTNLHGNAARHQAMR